MTLKELLTSDQYISIQLRATNFGHLELTARLNGVNALFLLDTGAASTVIDLEFANAREFPLTESSFKGGGVGTSELMIYQLEPMMLSLENFSISDAQIFAADLQHVKQSLMDKGETQIPCGVIGADILFQHRAVIDYHHLLLYMQH